MDKGFVFVSTNYRLLPQVDMETIVRDIAKSIRWVHDHIAEYGGDPQRLFIMGHSAGAQLAALVCTDDRYLKAEGLSLAIMKGCVPVDGDTYDVPAIIETAETRRRAHGQPQLKFGHREKFGNDPAKHRDFSAVTHVAKDKGIPPFLIMHVADHPDTSAQAQRLASVLKEAGVPSAFMVPGSRRHNKINADIGITDDPGRRCFSTFSKKPFRLGEFPFRHARRFPGLRRSGRAIQVRSATVTLPEGVANAIKLPNTWSSLEITDSGGGYNRPRSYSRRRVSSRRRRRCRCQRSIKMSTSRRGSFRPRRRGRSRWFCYSTRRGGRSRWVLGWTTRIRR